MSNTADQAKLIRLARTLRGAGVADTFLNGSCIYFYLLAKIVSHKVYGFLHNEEHVVVECEGDYFDVNGRFKVTGNLTRIIDLDPKTTKQLLDTSK